MFVPHWTLIDYAYCHLLSGSNEYKLYLDLYQNALSKGMHLSDKELLGLFYGMTSEAESDKVKIFIEGSFKPSHKDYAYEYITKPKASINREGLVKAVLNDVMTTLKLKKRNGSIEVPTPYFDSLIKTYNILLSSLIKEGVNKKGSERIKTNIKESLKTLSKGGLYKSNQ